MSQELHLRIVVLSPPAGVDFALQKGHNHDWEVVGKQRSNRGDVVFDFAVSVRPGRKLAFGGPFVQGPASEKFVYINIGTYAGQKDSEWDRRLKVPLYVITPRLMASAPVLVAEVPGTDKRGGPSCAYTWRKEVGKDWNWKPAKK